ncbi:MAG: oligosaccharide flippase family protein [Candidatus Omnitrophica bacterium]|nr:oligosaccharide flippase family protein [Candidatus Omnitrophota bacterium]
MKKMLKATATASSITVSNIFTALVRSKFTAVVLGTSGVGLFSQAFNLLNFSITVASLGIGRGVTKYVSTFSAQDKEEKTSYTISFAVMTQLAATVALAVLMVVFSGFVSRYLFLSESYSRLVLFLAVSIPLIVLSGTFEAVLVGFGHYKNFTYGRVAAALISLVPLFGFIYFMGFRGTFPYLLASSLIAFGIGYYLIYRKVPREVFASIFDFRNLIKRYDKGLSRMILSYGATSFITGGLGLFCVVFLRTILINYFGPEANGLYQVVFAMSANYLTLFTNGIWAYFFPKVSSLSAGPDKQEYMNELNNALRFCLVGVIPFAVCLYILRDVVIRVVFSVKFLPAADLFSTQLAGDMFYLIFYLLCASLLAREKLKMYLGIGLVYNACLVVVFLCAAGHMGLRAITFSYMVSNMAAALILVFYHSRVLGVKISHDNLKLAVKGALVLGAVFFTGDFGILGALLKTVFTAVCIYFILTEHERGKVFGYIRSKLSYGRR